MNLEANAEDRNRRFETADIDPLESNSRHRVAYRSGWIVGGLIVGLLALVTTPVRGQNVCTNVGNACQPADPNDCTEETAGCCLALVECTPPEDTCCDDDPTQLCCPCAGVGEFPDATSPLIPLSDLTGADYLGTYEMGLYSENATSKTNTIPAGHKTSALTRGSRIIPLNQFGIADPMNGLIGVVSMGFSNVHQEFETLVTSKIEPLTYVIWTGSTTVLSSSTGLREELKCVSGKKSILSTPQLPGAIL